ncbi:general odorant-binding protein 57c [Drosophila yakuba]|uniref:Odorant-binding protein 57c n=1 Tax=Drosophila yakuba TaxID=7245 RepID=B4PAK9_DROYA|nr:general odorant-binding protein 57c [Drosophila yakuba]EDW91400.1 Odorant-binding protein 57c [Drosophila yakuba]
MFRVGLLCILACSVVSIQSFSLLEETYVSDCLASNNISHAEFQELIDRSSEEDDIENTEWRYKCLIHCLAEKGSLLDSNGYLDVERIDQLEPVSDELRAILYDCKKVYDQEEDLCEYAFRMVICVTDSFESDEVTEAMKNTNKLNE